MINDTEGQTLGEFLFQVLLQKIPRTFPFSRGALKGFNVASDMCLTSSGVWFDVHLGKMDVKSETRIFGHTAK